MHECIDAHIIMPAYTQICRHTRIHTCFIYMYVDMHIEMHTCISAYIPASSPVVYVLCFFQSGMPGIVGGMAMAPDHTVRSASLMDMVR